MIAAISRFTTDYVDSEDRLRLTGEVAEATPGSAPVSTPESTPVSMWLTQRLALRLVTSLLRWLDIQIGATVGKGGDAASRSSVEEMQKQVVHGFAQEAALAELKRLEPVPAAAGAGWLIQSIDVTPRQQGIGLVFRAADGRAAGLGMTVAELRQWLAIVRTAWLQAGWSEAAWPVWMNGEAKPAERHIVLH